MMKFRIDLGLMVAGIYGTILNLGINVIF